MYSAARALPHHAVASGLHGFDERGVVDRVLGEHAHVVGQARTRPHAADAVERGLHGGEAVLAVHPLDGEVGRVGDPQPP